MDCSNSLKKRNGWTNKPSERWKFGLAEFWLRSFAQDSGCPVRSGHNESMDMLETLLVLGLGLIPPLVSVLVIQKAEAQARERLQIAMSTHHLATQARRGNRLSPDHHYVEGLGYIVGDLTCQFNARSSYIRCAVNPYGPCQNCPHYEPIEFA